MSKYPLNSVSYEIVEQTGSTNTDLLERIRKHGLKTIVARQALIQTQGRGTRGRVWDSHGDCLMFSVALPIGNDLRRIKGVTLAIGAFIALALRERSVPAQVKWPNDILLFDQKLAGILVETAKGPNRDYGLVVGIGLNLKKRNSAYAALSDSIRESEIEKTNWMEVFTQCIIGAVSEVMNNRLGRIQLLWDTIAAYKNQRVCITEENQQPYEAVVVGIDENGSLLVQCGSETKTLVSGMVRIQYKK